MAEAKHLINASVLMGLVAALCWGSADFFGAVIARKIGTLSAMVGMHIASMALYAGIYLWLRPDVSSLWGDMLPLTLMSVVAVATYLTFYKGLQIGPVAVVAPIVSAYAAVVVVLAVLVLGERLTRLETFGAAVAIGGAVLASADLRIRSAKRLPLTAGTLLGLGALIGFGVNSFFAGSFAQTYDWFTPALVVRVLSTFILVGIAAGKDELPWRKTRGLPLLGVAAVGIIEAAGFLAFSRGAELGHLALAAAASASYPVIPLILGPVVLGERLAPNQWVGILSVLGGVIVLSLGGHA